jgi:predicted DsbA family dithiol-disulfide isomerase
VRLADVREEFGDRVAVHWRAFPLIPGQQPGRRATEKTREGRFKVAADEPRARFAPPAVDTPLPSSSVPAQIAAKCAERQGTAAFARFHARLFVAQFHDNADIGRHDVLRGLARDCALDLERFTHDYASEDTYQAVLEDCAEGAGWFGVSALPTVVLNEKLSLVGAVPVERYRALIEWILAGEPGGVIPLAPPSGAPGQSVVARPERA